MTAISEPKPAVIVETYREENPLRLFVRHLLRKRSAQIGLTIILMLFVSAVFGQKITPYDPFELNVPERLQAPSARHLFGTDEQGRDLLSRVIVGARISVVIMLVTTSISALFGVLLGILSAYFGGWTDTLIMRVVDVMLGFPYILLILAIVAILGPSLTNAMISIGVANIPDYARLTRSVALLVKEQDYVLAERALGAGELRILFHTVLHNIISPIIIFISFSMPTALLAAASLSFLGLGAQPPQPEWGAMMVKSRDFLTFAPWVVLAPGLAIFTVILGINLFGNALRDVLDPRDTQLVGR